MMDDALLAAIVQLREDLDALRRWNLWMAAAITILFVLLMAQIVSASPTPIPTATALPRCQSQEGGLCGYWGALRCCDGTNLLCHSEPPVSRCRAVRP